MAVDYGSYFKKYLALVKTADAVFERMAQEYPECVTCQTACSDCCHALFDLTLIEAIYLNDQFNKKFHGPDKDRILQKANKVDRRIHQIKRKAHQALRSGGNQRDILENLASERVRCPLLNERQRCDLYEYRPITCRFYGVPTAIGGQGHTCGKSGFVRGKSYPSVNLDAVHRQLQEITAEFLRDINTRYIKLVDMLIPPSMALLTVFDEEYLGIDGGSKNAASGK
ncbi:MAG: YkgJ family cysteine cluster protein [Desulfobacterales bacterium]|jgi:Fe-S-cluster containining protein